MYGAFVISDKASDAYPVAAFHTAPDIAVLYCAVIRARQTACHIAIRMDQDAHADILDNSAVPDTTE